MMEGDIREATEKMRKFLIAAPTSGAGSIEDMGFIICKESSSIKAKGEKYGETIGNIGTPYS